MFEFELHHLRSADLIREADNERLAREAVRSRRAARREAARRAAEGEVHTARRGRPRTARTA
ncbi:hypothetical protein Stsp02_40040 [Streptomyces sp. NBRC 14336]|uniref:hypothetical protein n=1 Tax=Streptomyces sp. NBRC 14336 TaxID=3030992 RepID=UPI0024A02188|nr:hypothetical protein [Streptomyces sp. NBRC 14336]WBO80512.1 hypothetical protein SBE_004295 [Streptomyces sp. SBE_14.2]GLW48342.1 hypothetical protein Stsp02_40040 [Streptomyces sp. NBRC 14336]